VAIGAMIRRLDVFAAATLSARNGDSRQISPAATPSAQIRDSRSSSPAASEPAFAEAPAAGEPAFAAAPAAVEVEPDAAAADEPVDESRSGGSPTIAAIEPAPGEAAPAPGEAAPAPTLVGRYSAGGASYLIFSDGSIEAETKSGAYKFASMAEFKAYLADARA
jgi:hypothetical protein